MFHYLKCKNLLLLPYGGLDYISPRNNSDDFLKTFILCFTALCQDSQAGYYSKKIFLPMTSQTVSCACVHVCDACEHVYLCE